MQKQLLISFLILAAGALAFWMIWRFAFDDKHRHQVAQDAPAAMQNQPPPPTTTPVTTEQTPTTAAASTQPSPEDSTPAQSYDAGLEALKAGKLIEARNALSKAFFSGKLSAKQQADAISKLTDLANRTIFSHTIFDNDPYEIAYKVSPGDVLANVERGLKLHVPPQIILSINGMKDGGQLQAGKTVKLIQGPFHAIVTKHDFTMDIYLQHDNLPKIFVRRFQVGLGKDGSTPVGAWRVAMSKVTHPDYSPAPNSPNRDRGVIHYGEPGYAFGQKGLWIGLDGTDDDTRDCKDYGIHSTNDPKSIGKEGSEGCVRCSDDDIDMIYSLLYPVWSTVLTKE
jgi:lipoprotein-anchoring transpeptidase ErfK/SrfK